ncbi:MAG: hypothetical protein WCE81_13160 [Halobacteriota archaeon]
MLREAGDKVQVPFPPLIPADSDDWIPLRIISKIGEEMPYALSRCIDLNFSAHCFHDLF